MHFQRIALIVYSFWLLHSGFLVLTFCCTYLIVLREWSSPNFHNPQENLNDFQGRINHKLCTQELWSSENPLFWNSSQHSSASGSPPKTSFSLTKPHLQWKFSTSLSTFPQPWKTLNGLVYKTLHKSPFSWFWVSLFRKCSWSLLLLSCFAKLLAQRKELHFQSFLMMIMKRMNKGESYFICWGLILFGNKLLNLINCCLLES